MSHPLPISREQQVTASELVRHFGTWQERAAREPVYVLHRGRPRFVLTSLDIMEALCAPHDPSQDKGTPTFAALLDADDGMTLIAGPDGKLAAASHGARRRFGAAVEPGVTVVALAAAGADQLADALARALHSGEAEDVEATPALFPDRRYLFALAPFPGGCVIRLRDLTAADEAAEARHALQAMRAAADAAGALVTRITPRGHIADPSPALARTTGIAPESIATARFASLVEIRDRVAVGEAIERCFDTAEPTRTEMRLLVRGAASLPAVVGLAPLREAGRVTALLATIVPA